MASLEFSFFVLDDDGYGAERDFATKDNIQEVLEQWKETIYVWADDAYYRSSERVLDENGEVVDKPTYSSIEDAREQFTEQLESAFDEYNLWSDGTITVSGTRYSQPIADAMYVLAESGISEVRQWCLKHHRDEYESRVN